jgi:cephalosporin-C deacetylase
MQVDLPLDQLETYEYPAPEPDDFDAFWATTLGEHADVALEPRFEPVDAALRTIETIDVTFRGYGGTEVKAWLLLPAHRDGPLPVIVEYLGYGSGRGLPVESLGYSSAGFAHAILDTRGQGSTSRTGDTSDPFGSAPSVPGFLTRGILNRDDYYYRRLYTDAYRFVDVIRSHDAVDASRITVTGRSQGGALSLVAAALRDDIALAVPHVAFLCAFQRAVQMTDQNPYGELVRWMATHRTEVDQAFATLAYFDGVSFARRAGCPAKFSVALRDLVSPPSTVYAAYNAYGGPKDMTIWRFNGHEAGGPEDTLRTIRAIRELA